MATTLPTQPRALVLLNPRSRKGGATDVEGALERLEHEAGFSTERLRLRDFGEAARIMRNAKPRHDLVIVGGGDGTMHRLLEPLLEVGLPVGLIPLGTANDLARTLGIPLDPEAACAVISQRRVRRIDIGRVNGMPYLNVASFGLSAAFAQHLDEEQKRRFGVLSYALRLKQVLRAVRPFGVEIRHEGGREVLRSIMVAIGNGRHHGGGLTVGERARIDDGLLDLYTLSPQSAGRLLLLLPALRRGQHVGREGVLHRRGTWFDVRTRRPMPINADGEIRTSTPARFEVVQQALPMFVPEAL